MTIPGQGRKVALVTGANTGIGRTVALGVAAAGWQVVGHWFEAPAKAASLQQKIGDDCRLVHADLREESGLQAVYAVVDELDGPLDLVVNNAGFTGWTPDVLAVGTAEWDSVFGVNVRATFFSCIEAYRRMKDHQRGSIVNISSNIAALAIPQLAAYGTSKAAVNALTRQLAVEFAPHGVRVNAVAPGPTVVERTLRDDPDYATTWGRMVPLGRAADPDDVLGPLLFLASDAARYVTGHVLYADGGWSQAGTTPPPEHLRPGTAPDRHAHPAKP
ncbi:SDR family NAD(P)-dependent oxidoreductase [Streptomyces sp. NPDC094448]|uniref:SDR family NAD(P)-dependent oxidoreductase n=1 Tax=Streptomyces sp. NPDC094448 TaxID=3366063 RepID=UPI003801F1CF